MPELDQSDNDAAKARKAKPAQEDATRNPDGVYSGMTKRLAITDGSFVDISGMPKSSRNRKLRGE
jgi:hypothetical protein